MYVGGEEDDDGRNLTSQRELELGDFGSFNLEE
jgi:hypothetical protein